MKFASVDSFRLRLGAQWQNQLGEDKDTHTYLGIAWEHEFDGRAKASIYGYHLDTAALSGGTGIVEMGFAANPYHKSLTLDFDLQGYAGRHEGAKGSIRANYRF
ncbi:MAG: autotransporter domain-containing protein [Zoogloeaceae bacterium]|nr:autotransporter domain-containing protein [Zoogloeaceae bacterium]